jgi:hypothetical protein
LLQNYDISLQYCSYKIGDLIHYLSALRKYQLYFCQKTNAFGYKSFLQWIFCAWHKLELGTKVYDQSQAHGHLKDQNLLFFVYNHIIYHIIYDTTT